MNPNSELPWIIFELNQQLYAISTEMVTGIAQMPFITGVAGAPETYLGVANIRGEIIPILDLKKLLRISSGQDERQRLTETLEFKKKGAEMYLKELRRCIQEQERFAATPDLFGDDIDIGYAHEQSEMIPMAKNIQQIQKELLTLADRVNTDKRMAATAETECSKFIHAIETSIAFINNDSTRLIITLTNEPDSSTTCMGFVVDNVRSVDAINLVKQEGHSNNLLFSTKIIGGVAHNDKIKGEILVVDDGQIEETLDNYKEAVQKAKEAAGKSSDKKGGENGEAAAEGNSDNG
ncbi:MAG: chemotaxis protein CheW [Firmicutes bacterium]|nr:chemotaxis protein CheW [[Eubacterium] siraeum]MCM1487169.1 chemotaxis protein CheW [Bacillota bacterium]